MKQEFILASASPRRSELLKQIYYTPKKIIPAKIDEIPLKNEKPSEFAKRMSVEKAQKIFETNLNDLVLACDTVVACGRRILPKAENEKDALNCLKMLSGKSHRVYSGLCLMSKNTKSSKVIMSRVTFKKLSEREMKDYIASKEWQGKAGGYAIQGLAAMFIIKVSGSYSNIVGLPLYETSQMLMGKGIYPNADHK